jgi:NAD(P)H-dependent FMN reductase
MTNKTIATGLQAELIGRVRVLGIAGSLRAGSFTHQILGRVVDRVRRRGATAQVFDLREQPLPFCSGDKDDPYSTFPAVARLREAAIEAHALVLATPEYHGGVSGVLKNVLDLLDFEHLEGKVIGGISVLGGPQDSNSLNDLRRIARWCHAWMIPEQVAVGHVRHALCDGEPNDPRIRARLDMFADSLLLNTLRLSDGLGRGTFVLSAPSTAAGVNEEALAG